MNFNNLTIRTKLIFAFSFLVVITLGVFVMGTANLSGMNDQIDRISSETSNKIKVAARINQDILFISRAEKNLVLAQTESEMQEYATAIESRKVALQQRILQLNDLVDEDGRTALQNFQSKWKEYNRTLDKIIEFSMLNSNMKASNLSQGDANKIFDQAVLSLTMIRDNFKNKADQSGATSSIVNSVYLSSSLLETLRDIQSAEKDFILAEDIKTMDKIALQLEGFRIKGEQLISGLTRTITSLEDKLAFEQFKKEYNQYKNLSEEVIRLASENGNKKAFELSTGEARSLHDEATAAMALIVDKNDRQLEIDAAESDANYASARNGMILLTLIAVAVSALIAYWIINSISKSIAEAKQALSKVAEGDLSSDVEIRNEDEIGDLLKALQRTVVKLREIIGSVRGAVENIASASQQLSSSSQEVAQGASEQAASAEEVSSSMEEMSSTIQQNTDNASQTEKIAMKASETMELTNSSVSRTVQSMREIAEKINVIGEIANKTDLLALNAAVEAARAGEHGKGFAVVASAVRKLAESSQLAANEINGLTEDSVQVSEKSGELLKEIVPDIQRTAQLVQEISASSREQSTGAEQVNMAIQQLNEVTQRNASAAEEMATSSEELASQAQELESTISFFKVDEKAVNKTKVKDRSAAKLPKSEGEKSDAGYAISFDGDAVNDEDFEAYK